MTELTEQERLEKNVVDTEADYRRYKAAADLWNAEVFDDAVFAAYAALVKAIGSSNAKWRIKPTKKVIDLSVLIESGIDCEFSDEESFGLNFLGTLTDQEGRDYHKYSGNSGDGFVRYAKYCRPRMNHIHAWQGGECPLPEGFRVKVWFRNGKEGDAGGAFHLNLRWSHEKWESDIIAFEVLGLADGYVMPWEQDDE